MDVFSFFNTVLALSAAVIVLNEYVSRFTKADGRWARLQSWVVSILLGVFGTWLNLGIFADMEWKGGMLVGVICGLVANGIFDIEMVKRLLETLRVRSLKA